MSAPPEHVDDTNMNGHDHSQSFNHVPSHSPSQLRPEHDDEGPGQSSRSPKRRSRHDDDTLNDERAKRKLRKKEKGKKKDKKNEKSSPDYEVGITIEMPTTADFTRRYGFLDMKQYHWGPSSQRPTPPVPSNVRASMPSVPDAMDDRPLPKEEPPQVPKNEAEEEDRLPRVQIPVRVRAQARRAPRPRRPVAQTPPVRPEGLEWWQEHPIKRMKGTLDHMPPEVRRLIYRGLLVARNPILVYGKWTKIYPRQKPALHINILLVCRRFHLEGIPVLYGENEFLYRLRDPAALCAELFDVSQLPHDDEADGGFESLEEEEIEEFSGLNDSEENEEDEEDTDDDGDGDYDGGDGNDDDGSEYEEERVQRTMNRRPKATGPDIFINKFRHLIRRIIVEAESNRCSREVKGIMAQAIQVFAYRGCLNAPEQEDESSTIHTLTIRVAPTHTGGVGGRWTFLDFFDAKSVVVKAALETQPCFLRVELARRKQSAAAAAADDMHGTRLTGDMRPYRATQRARAGLPDAWGEDPAMLAGRQQRTHRCYRGLVELRERVLDCCRRRWVTANDSITEEAGEEGQTEFWACTDWDNSDDLE